MQDITKCGEKGAVKKRIVPKKMETITITDLNAIAELCKWKKRNFIILNNFKELYTEIL